MNPLSRIPAGLRALGYLWATPTTVASLILWFLPMWVLGQLRPVRWYDGVWEWALMPLSWFEERYCHRSNYAATTLGYCIFLCHGYENSNRIHVHERRHVVQNMILGPLFLPLYALGYLIGWYRGATYRMNPFEVDARKAAHEPV